MVILPDIPLIDSRTQEDLFEEMRKSLKNKGIYIKDDDGEILSALAVLYSNMLADTIKRLNRTPEKHRIAFLNMAHTPPRPAWPSSGMVAFEVADGYDHPVTIQKGTRVAADIDGQPISFRLRSDLTAVPANLTDIYWCDPTIGRYGYARDLSRFCPWNLEDTQETAYKADFIFKNVFYHDNEAALFINASLRESQVSAAALLRATRWSISPYQQDEPAFLEMDITENPDGRLYLRIKEPLPHAENIIIRMELNDPDYSELIITDIHLMQFNGAASPDSVLTSTRGLDVSSFYPFGFPMCAFEECGIFCDAALSQKRAEIALSFSLKLELSEERSFEPPEMVDYKWIMRKPLAKPEPVVYDAFAKSVRLEYWDGSTYREIRDVSGRGLDFTRENERIELIFDCPDDIMPCEYYGVTGYYLRLSCAECDELYKLPRRVYTPRISGFKFHYRHTEKYYPVKVETESFGRWREVNLNTQEPLVLFERPGQAKTLLLGFDMLAWECRMKMYINIENSKTQNSKAEKIKAKIYSEHDEQSLTVFDMTNTLASSGVLWLDIPENMQPSVLFGKNRYWVELPVPAETLPVISGIYLNAAIAENKIRCEESFTYSHLKNKRLTLAHENIIHAWVYVRSLTGIGMELWREYSEADGKFRTGYYMLDYISGLVTFPDDIIARSINEDMLDLIRIVYDATDGGKANLPANSITRMEEDIPFIKSVRNPVAIANGAVGESGEELATRKRHALYNGERVVSKRDFELFAVDNCPLVSDAKCTYSPAEKTVILAVQIKKDAGHTAFIKVKKNLAIVFRPFIQDEIHLKIIPWEDASC